MSINVMLCNVVLSKAWSAVYLNCPEQNTDHSFSFLWIVLNETVASSELCWSVVKTAVCCIAVFAHRFSHAEPSSAVCSQAEVSPSIAWVKSQKCLLRKLNSHWLTKCIKTGGELWPKKTYRSQKIWPLYIQPLQGLHLSWQKPRAMLPEPYTSCYWDCATSRRQWRRQQGTIRQKNLRSTVVFVAGPSKPVRSCVSLWQPAHSISNTSSNPLASGPASEPNGALWWHSDL